MHSTPLCTCSTPPFLQAPGAAADCACAASHPHVYQSSQLHQPDSATHSPNTHFFNPNFNTCSARLNLTCLAGLKSGCLLCQHSSLPCSSLMRMQSCTALMLSRCYRPALRRSPSRTAWCSCQVSLSLPDCWCEGVACRGSACLPLLQACFEAQPTSCTAWCSCQVMSELPC
jgi:hypothetical protein